MRRFSVGILKTFRKVKVGKLFFKNGFVEIIF